MDILQKVRAKAEAVALADESTRPWLMQNLRILEQYASNKDHFARDEYMAENIGWILAQNPGSRIAAWAHNGHIQKIDGEMGAYLDREMGDEYVAVGFAVYSGTHTVWGDSLRSDIPIDVPGEDCYEHWFHAAGAPIFALDLRRAVADKAPQGEWLRSKGKFRAIGATVLPVQFWEYNLRRGFDIIIFIDETSASELLD